MANHSGYYMYETAPSGQRTGGGQAAPNTWFQSHGVTVGGVLTVLGLAVLVTVVLHMLNFRFAMSVRR